MKAILIATIGTRDLSFQINSGEWYNIGDDRMQNGEIIGEQTEVIVEGLVCQFILLKYKNYIQYSNPNQPHTPYIEADNLPSNLHKWFEKSKSQRHGNVGLHGRPLFTLLELSFTTQEWNSNPDIQKFIRYTVDERNTAFHGLGGLQEQELYQAWGKDIKTQQQWKQRVLSCLNFISGQNFRSLADGSIFGKLHNLVVSKLENVD